MTRRACLYSLGVLLLFAATIAHGQTLLNMTNRLEFARSTDVIMESEGTYRVTVVRSTGIRGKLSVDVTIKTNAANTNIVVPVSWKGTNLVFNDYQLSASFDLPIQDNTLVSTNPPATVQLQLTNPTLAPDQDPALTPLTGTKSLLTITAVDDDDPNKISLGRVNNWAFEGDSIQIPVKIGATPTDAQGLSVTFKIRPATLGEVAPGADIAAVQDDPLTPGIDENDLQQGFQLTGEAFFGTTNIATITIPTREDNLLEYDEEFIVELTGVNGDVADPKSTNTPPDRKKLTLSAQTLARGRILFNTNFAGTFTRPAQPVPAGSVDRFFNPDNEKPLLLRRPGANGPVTAVASDFNNRYYIAGNFTAVDGFSRAGVARLTSTGTVDTAFSPAMNLNGAVTSMDVYRNGPRNGQVLIGGDFSSVNGEARNSVARYLANGALDLGFQVGLGANGPIYTVKAEGDNSTIIAGDFTMFDGVPRGHIARLRSDGSLDTQSFADSGANGPIYDLNVQIAAPYKYTNSQTADTNTFTWQTTMPGRAGTIEITYNNLGFTNNWSITFGTQTFFSAALTNDFVLVTNSDNTITTNYIPVTRLIDLPILASAPQPLTVKIQPGSITNSTSWTFGAVVTPLSTISIVAVGDFTTFNDVPINRVVKMGEFGDVDQVFASSIGTGADGTVLAVDVQTDLSLIIGGVFANFNSQPAHNIARLNQFGSWDPDFASGTGANGPIRDIFVDRADDPTRKDRIYIGGEFTSYNNSRRIFLARLMPDGYLDTTFMDSAFNQFAGFPNTNGYAPNGTIASITIGKSNPGPVVGGTFDLVGGGTNRMDTKPRLNFARLVGGQTPGPGNFSFTSPLFGADEAGDVLVTTMTFTNQSTNVLVANGFFYLNTSDLSATANVDYQPITGPFVVDPRTNDWFLYIPLIDDTQIEGDEQFRMDLVDVLGFKNLGGEPVYPEFAFGPIAHSIGRIIDNDVPPAVFSFSRPEYNIDENRATATIQIYRTGSTDNRVTVQFSALPFGGTNSASTPSDFLAVTNQIVVFNAGVTNVAVTVAIRDDTIVEPDEKVKLLLQTPSIGAVLDTNSLTAVLNIVDNDLPAGKIDFDAGGFTVVEGQLNAVVTASRSGGSVGLISVDYQTADGTATNGLDYIERSGRLTWNDRDIATRTILIPIIDDNLIEGAETFSVSLSNGSQAGVVGTRHPTATVTIVDNDFFGSLQLNGSQFYTDETSGSAVIDVVRRGGSAGTVSVTVTTSPGTNPATAAVPGVDYVNVTNTLTFGPGETAKSFTIPILDDSVVDGTRDVVIKLSNPVNASLGTNTTGILSIIDNETVNVPAGGVDTEFVTADGANAGVNVVRVSNESTNAASRRILIAGEFTQYSHLNREHIARLNNDGTLDRNYGANTHIDASIRAALLLPDGRTFIGGHFTHVDDATVKYVALLDAVGHYDSSFQPGAGPDNAVYALASTFAGDPTNNLARILIGGDFVTFNSQPRQRIAMTLMDGTLDPNFNPASGPNGAVYAIAVQRDQKILIGGDFTTVAGIARAHIARLNVDGSLDLSFDPGIGFDAAIRAIAIQDDDQIVVAGDFTTVMGNPGSHIARLQTSGLVDASFDVGTGADGPVNSVALQPDGKIVIGGDFVTVNGAIRRSIARLLPSGANDNSINFGSGPNGVVQSVDLQSDQGIVFGGDFTEVDGYPRERVARVYGGAISGGGALEFDSANYTVNESSGSVAIKIRRTGGLEGTISANYVTIPVTATPNADYVELTTNIVTFQPGEQFRTISVPILDDLIPEDIEYFQVALTNAVGGAIGRQPLTTVGILSDDTRVGFATDSFVVNENSPAGRAIITLALQGTISQPVTVSVTTSDGTATAPADYAPVNAQVTFSPGDTTKTIDVPIVDDTIVEGDETVNLSVQLVTSAPNVTLGTPTAVLTIADNDNAPGVLQFVGDVSVDEGAGLATLTVSRSAGKLGAVTVDYTTQDGTAHAPGDYTARSGTLVFQQTDTSKSIVIPISEDTEVEGNENFTVSLSNATGGAQIGPASSATVTIVDNDFGAGSLDKDFDIGAGATGPGATVYAMALQPDGKVVIGGNFTDFDNSGHPRLARLLPTGSIDPDFASGSGPDATVYALGLVDAGRIDVGGAFRSFNSLDRRFFTRVTASGAPDISFTSDTGLNDYVRALDPQANFNVVIGGAFTSPSLHAGRVLVSGAFDVSLNVGAGANANVLDAKVQPDGKIIFAGQFTQFGNLARGHVARVLTNGLVDQTFNTSIGANGDVNRVLPLSNGRVLVAGSFTSFNSSAAGRIAVLNDDGSVDTNFVANIGTGANGAIWAVGLQSDGRIVIGGAFTSFNGQGRTRIARLNADGSLDASFKPGLGPDNTVYDIEIQSDQKILISGAFTQVNGFNRRGVARLNSPTAEISVTSIALVASDLTLTFASESGISYVVEATDDLNNPNWTIVKDNITGSGSSTTTTIPFDPTNPHRFFRIRKATP